MAFEDELDPDWFYELPFYLTALVVYGAAFTLNPTLRWGARERAPDPSVPIEFVATLPAPSPNLAPAPGGDGKTEQPPQKGPGEYVPEKTKAGAEDAPPKPLPKPKPAAVKSAREKLGATMAHRPAKPKPVAKPVDAKAVIAASIARRHQLDQVKAAKAAAAVEAARRAAQAQAVAIARAEQARAAAAVRAEAAREKAQAAAELKAERAAEARALKAQHDADVRAAAARRAEAVRVAKAKKAAAEKARRDALAAEREAKARKKAELSQELATMSDPDEALAQDADSSGGGAAVKGKPRPAASAAKAGAAAALASGAGADADGGTDDDGAALAGARKAGAAAALADTAESADPGDAGGSGGADLLDAQSKGGGTGPDGSGVSYSLDGPVGSRRVLKRPVPTSPDWVGARGLDLTVTVRFQVLPDGKVKAGAVIQKTSGFPEIDRRALDALRKWRFEAAPTDDDSEIWGRVTFRFTS